MSTPAQLDANRANAQLSTGPKTAAGKQRSSRNAVTHGFNATEFIVRDGEREVFDEFRAALRSELAPRGAHAAHLFHQYLHAAWQLHRINRAEAELFENGVDPLRNPDHARQLELLARYHSRHERSMYRALKALRDYQTNQVARGNGLPAADAQSFPPLADIHSIHRARRTATRAYPAEDLVSVPRAEKIAADLRDALRFTDLDADECQPAIQKLSERFSISS